MAAEQPAAALPSGWAEHKDPASGNPYFHNLVTNEVTWTRPTAAADGGAAAAAAAQAQQAQAQQGLAQAQPQAQQSVDPAYQAQLQQQQLQQQQLQQMQMQQPVQQFGQQPQAFQTGFQQAFDPTQAQQPAQSFDPSAFAGNGQQGFPQQQAFGQPQAGLGQPLSGSLQSGTVRNWIEDKGFGFISPSNGGEDIFVHRSVLEDGQALDIGSTVTYESAWNDKRNKFAVTRLVGATAKGGGKGGAGCGKGAPDMANGGSLAGQTFDMSAAAAGGGGGLPVPAGLQPGMVRNWIEEKGFGFITPNAGVDEVFVHRCVLEDGQCLVPGTQVHFEYSWNAERNKYAVTRCIGAVPKGGGKGGCPGGCGGGFPGVDGGAAMAALGGGFAAPPVTDGSFTSGSVKAWYEDKGFGFLVPEGGGEDVFVHRNSLIDGMSLMQGARVTYKTEWNPQKGKYLATECTGAFGDPKGKGKGKGGFDAVQGGGGYDAKGYGKSWNGGGQDFGAAMPDQRYAPYGQ